MYFQKIQIILLKISYQTALISITSFADLLGLVSSSNISLGLFVMICWAIWQRRNKSRANKPFVPLQKIPTSALIHLQEFQRLRLKPHDKSGFKKIKINKKVCTFMRRNR